MVGTVPDKLSQVPAEPLYINFGGLRVTPNMTIDTSQVSKFLFLGKGYYRNKYDTFFVYGTRDERLKYCVQNVVFEIKIILTLCAVGNIFFFSLLDTEEANPEVEC